MPKKNKTQVNKKPYLKKLDEIIKYFEAKREEHTHYFGIGSEYSRYNISIFLSSIAILIAISNTLISLNIFIGFFIISFLLIIFSIAFHQDNRNNKKRYEDYFERSIEFDVIISFLNSLRLSEAKVDISSLIEKIKGYHRDKRILTTDNFRDIWLHEFTELLDVINNEIIRRETSI